MSKLVFNQREFRRYYPNNLSAQGAFDYHSELVNRIEYVAGGTIGCFDQNNLWSLYQVFGLVIRPSILDGMFLVEFRTVPKDQAVSDYSRKTLVKVGFLASVDEQRAIGEAFDNGWFVKAITSATEKAQMNKITFGPRQVRIQFNDKGGKCQQPENGLEYRENGTIAVLTDSGPITYLVYGVMRRKSSSQPGMERLTFTTSHPNCRWYNKKTTVLTVDTLVTPKEFRQVHEVMGLWLARVPQAALESKAATDELFESCDERLWSGKKGWQKRRVRNGSPTTGTYILIGGPCDREFEFETREGAKREAIYLAKKNDSQAGITVLYVSGRVSMHTVPEHSMWRWIERETHP